MTETPQSASKDELFSDPNYTNEEETEGAMFASEDNIVVEDTPMVPKEETSIRLSVPEITPPPAVTSTATSTASQAALTIIASAINKLSPSLTKLADRKASSSDIASFVTEVFDNALGFDKFSQLATSYNKKEDLMECLVSVEDKIRMVIKIVDSDKTPDDLDIEALETTIRDHKVGWVITTNGSAWDVYRDMGGKFPMKVSAFNLTDTAKSSDTLIFFTLEKFIEERSDSILDQYRPMFANIAHNAFNSEPGLKLIQEALAAEGISVGMGVVRTITKGVLHAPPN